MSGDTRKQAEDDRVVYPSALCGTCVRKCPPQIRPLCLLLSCCDKISKKSYGRRKEGRKEGKKEGMKGLLVLLSLEVLMDGGE